MIKTPKWLVIKGRLKPESINVYEDKSEFNFLNDKPTRNSFKKNSRNNSTTYQSQSQTQISKLLTINENIDSPIKPVNLFSQKKHTNKKEILSVSNFERTYNNLFKESTNQLPLISNQNNNSNLRVNNKKKTVPNSINELEKNNFSIRKSKKNDTQLMNIGKLKYLDLIKKHFLENYIQYENECEKCLTDYKRRKKLKLKIQLDKMGDALNKFNMIDYKNLENSDLCEENINKVQQLIKIVKLKDRFNDLDELTDLRNNNAEYRFSKDYSRFKKMKNISNSKFLKTFFKPKTIRKFYSYSGAYFGV